MYTRRTPSSRNYLRVRGEYGKPERVLTHQEELPPRARRIPGVNITALEAYGTTSACAENTNFAFPKVLVIGNYLRVRGEYDSFSSSAAFAWELPPRARRIRKNYARTRG